MRKIGHETLFLSTSEHNPRNGESTFARLKDGRIMMAYTEYYGTDWADHATARISAVYSSDERETWTKPVTIIEKEASVYYRRFFFYRILLYFRQFLRF